MTTMAEFINNRWTRHRATMTHTPVSVRTECNRAHGGDWDRWTWKGETQQSERAYCDCCGRMVRGNPSPWADAALADWYATPYMQRLFTNTRNSIRKQAIKFGQTGRRRMVLNTSR